MSTYRWLAAWRRLPVVALLCTAALLAACDGYYGDDDTIYPDDDNRAITKGSNNYDQPGPGLFGSDGLTVFSTLQKDELGAPGAGGGGGAGIGVNSFLWRASLDTVAFMPLASADPFGGVIITDWYSPPDMPDERFKVNVYILTRQLRSDGLKASIFKQVRKGNVWQDEPVGQDAAVQLEDAILTRARELRIAQLQ